MTDSNSNDSFIDGLFDDAIYEAPEPQKKEFLPWHLPRKQFVRKTQWCRQLFYLVRNWSSDKPIKYFGLPGIDLFDLKYIYTEICEKKNIPLCFLGFNQNASPQSENAVQLNISLDGIRRLPLVKTDSDVLGDNYCQLAKDNSIAWKKTKQLGPYDIINLDLCDGFAKGSPDSFDNNHYKALNKLLTLQSRYNCPWLLLLTTRVGNAHVNEDVFEIFKTAYKNNIAKSDNFSSVSKNLFEIETFEQIETALNNLKGQTDVFLTGLYKWILGIVLNQSPYTVAKLKNVIGYRVADGEFEDLISIALLMSPSFDSTPDPTGISSSNDNYPKEYDIAAENLSKIAKRLDADTILQEKPDLMQQMILEMEVLLSKANYDVRAYSEWAIKRSNSFLRMR